MPAGLIVRDANNVVTFDTASRMTRRIGVYKPLVNNGSIELTGLAAQMIDGSQPWFAPNRVAATAFIGDLTRANAQFWLTGSVLNWSSSGTNLDRATDYEVTYGVY